MRETAAREIGRYPFWSVVLSYSPDFKEGIRVRAKRAPDGSVHLQEDPSGLPPRALNLRGSDRVGAVRGGRVMPEVYLLILFIAGLFLTGDPTIIFPIGMVVSGVAMVWPERRDYLEVSDTNPDPNLPIGTGSAPVHSSKEHPDLSTGEGSAGAEPVVTGTSEMGKTVAAGGKKKKKKKTTPVSKAPSPKRMGSLCSVQILSLFFFLTVVVAGSQQLGPFTSRLNLREKGGEEISTEVRSFATTYDEKVDFNYGWRDFCLSPKDRYWVVYHLRENPLVVPDLVEICRPPPHVVDAEVWIDSQFVTVPTKAEEAVSHVGMAAHNLLDGVGDLMQWGWSSTQWAFQSSKSMSREGLNEAQRVGKSFATSLYENTPTPKQTAQFIVDVAGEVFGVAGFLKRISTDVAEGVSENVKVKEATTAVIAEVKGIASGGYEWVKDGAKGLGNFGEERVRNVTKITLDATHSVWVGVKEVSNLGWNLVHVVGTQAAMRVEEISQPRNFKKVVNYLPDVSKKLTRTAIIPIREFLNVLGIPNGIPDVVNTVGDLLDITANTVVKVRTNWPWSWPKSVPNTIFGVNIGAGPWTMNWESLGLFALCTGVGLAAVVGAWKM